jgi:hypothetical protein
MDSIKSIKILSIQSKKRMKESRLMKFSLKKDRPTLNLNLIDQIYSKNGIKKD